MTAKHSRYTDYPDHNTEAAPPPLTAVNHARAMLKVGTEERPELRKKPRSPHEGDFCRASALWSNGDCAYSVPRAPRFCDD